MTDRELLELAAKAAGGTIQWGHFGGGQEWLITDEVLGGLRPWRPLTDRGEALWLAETLHMTIVYEPSRGGWSCGAIVNGEFRMLSYHDNNLPRAIVLAAAAIGQSR